MPPPSRQRGFECDAFLEQVKALRLHPDSFAVIGSGILAVLGIRPARDVDLVVAPKIFAELQIGHDGWTTKKHHDTGSLFISKPPYDISMEWHDGTGRILELPELIPATQVYGGIRFVGLGSVLGWKERRNREKDRPDVQLIHSYALQHNLILPEGNARP